MENTSGSVWSEEVATWAQCQAAVNEGTSCRVPGWPYQFHGYTPVPLAEEDGAATASKSHSQAEKRRRDRINAQLATLRKLIPMSDKMDKAALLGSVVEHLKELKRRTSEVSKLVTIPTVIDEVTVIDFDEEASSKTGNIFIRASICCEDRPDLFAELNNAIKGLRLRIIQADMTSLGGRIRGTFVVCAQDCDRLSWIGGINNIKASLNVVLSRIVASTTSSNYRLKSKRQRFFCPPPHCSQ